MTLRSYCRSSEYFVTCVASPEWQDRSVYIVIIIMTSIIAGHLEIGCVRRLVRTPQLNTQRVRSRSEDRRARPGGGSSSSVAPTTTAGSLSTTADGPPEANPIA